jgi:tape measure domain-containing protein
MATISTNDIKIRYDIDLSQLQAATSQFDKLTAADRALLDQLAKLRDKFKETGEEGRKAPEKMIPPTKAAAGSIADLEAKVRRLNSEVKNTNSANSDYATKVKQLKAAQDELKKATDNLNNSLKNVKETTQKAEGGMSSFQAVAGKAGAALAGIFAASKIIEFGKAVVETTIKFESMQKAIDFASGSAEMGNKNFEFIRETAQKLGLDLRGAVEGYKTFASAANLAGQSSQETNRQFAAVAKAAQVMGLSAEDTKGAFLALGQMMSKGNVQAEELRGQLGERLVGAFGIAAKAMGVTTQELNKMLQKGQVLAADFLPKFATELENTFGKGNTQITTLAASQNRFNSSIDQLILAIGNRLNPFLKGAYDLAAGIASEISKAAGGGGAKKASDEQIAAKRTEAEIAQRILDISIKQGVFVSRQSAARQLLFEIDKRLTDAQLKQVDARITKDKVKLDAATKEFNILKEQENIYEKILGLVTITQQVQKPEDEKEKAKRLKKEYDDRLKLLELLKEQRILIGQLYGDPLAESGAEKAFFEAKLKLQKEYAAKGLEITNIEIQNTNLSRLNAEQIFNQKAKALRLDNYKEVVKTEEEIRKERAKTMQQGVNDAIEANNKIMANNAMMLKIKLQEEELKRQVMSKTVELAQTISDGAFGLYQARLNNEMTLLQRRYDEEIRLADGNQQKIDELNQQKAEKEKEIRTKQFKAEQAASIARILFTLGEQLIKYGPNPATAPLAVLAGAIAAAQIGIIAATPIPEFAEGTKGKPFKGGKAIVGERGVEKVVTESGKVYFTPPNATLVDLPKGSQVIPNHALSRQELFLANHYANRGSSGGSPMIGEIRELGSILKSLPITHVSMDEKGFEKFIRTPRRTTRILNNRFRSDSV